jgi:hypothetical protein
VPFIFSFGIRTEIALGRNCRRTQKLLDATVNGRKSWDATVAGRNCRRTQMLGRKCQDANVAGRKMVVDSN